MFDSLVDVSPSGEYQPRLATSWQISRNGSEVVFTLRDDVTWHPNAPTSESRNSGKVQLELFSSADVVSTVKLLKASSSEIPNQERFSAIAGAEAIGKSKVAIKLTRAMTDPLRVLMFKILPHSLVGSIASLRRDSNIARHPVGTGPYMFEKGTTQGEVLLKANASYFAGAPRIPSILLKSYTDQTIMAQSLMFNALDLVTYISPRDLGEVLGDRKLTVVPYDALSYSFFAMNTSRGVLKDKRVRQAISAAINRKEMLDAFFQGKGRLISGPFPPTSWAYNIEVPNVTFDVTRAQGLLRAAGLNDRNGDGILETENGMPVKLVFAVPLAGESEVIKRIVLAFQGYLQKAGIKVELQFMDWLVWKRKVLADQDYDMTIASWSFDDSSNISSLFHSSSAVPWGNNFVQYRNKEVDSLLTEADTTNDFDKRRAIYHKLHVILADEVPYVYLWTLMHHAAHSNRLSGLRVEPFGFFKQVATWNFQSGGHAKQ